MERMDCCSYNKKPFRVCYNCCSDICSRCSIKCKGCSIIFCIWCVEDLTNEKIFESKIELDVNGEEVEVYYCDLCIK